MYAPSMNLKLIDLLMTDVIVTGANGFIGRALCDRLKKDGFDVFELSHEDGDITNFSVWDRLPRAQAIVHLAALTYVPDSWKSPTEFITKNVVGTQMALEWCKRSKARMVFASAYVYGIPHSLPICESNPAKPNNPYALSKFLGEQCCEFASHFFGIDTTALRLFNVYGLGQSEEFLIPTIIKQISGNEICLKDITPRRDYVYLLDVVEAFVRALNIALSGFHKINIGSGKSYSVAEVADTLQAILGRKLPLRSSAEIRQQEIPDIKADISLSEQLLGWMPSYDLSSGFHDMLVKGGYLEI